MAQQGVALMGKVGTAVGGGGAQSQVPLSGTFGNRRCGPQRFPAGWGLPWAFGNGWKQFGLPAVNKGHSWLQERGDKQPAVAQSLKAKNCPTPMPVTFPLRHTQLPGQLRDGGHHTPSREADKPKGRSVGRGFHSLPSKD